MSAAERARRWREANPDRVLELNLKRTAASRKHYWSNRESILSGLAEKRRLAGIPKRERLTDEERRKRHAERDTRRRRAKGIPERKRMTDEERAAKRRTRSRRSQTKVWRPGPRLKGQIALEILAEMGIQL